jgi:hypothetical protein
MKLNKISILTIFFIFISTFLYAAEISHIEAKQIVRNLPCTEGETIDQYLNKKASISAVDDLGWKAYPREDGYEIERLMILMSKKK